MPSHSMRAILETLELASGSLVPRPTTISSVSWRETSGAASLSAASMRCLATSSSFRSMASSRAKIISISGFSAPKLLTSDGRSFLTWPAANSIPGTQTIRSAPRSFSLSSPVRMTGVANSRNPLSTSKSGSLFERCPANWLNSSMAASSRLPWPQIMTAVFSVITLGPCLRALSNRGRFKARAGPAWSLPPGDVPTGRLYRIRPGVKARHFH